MRAAGGATIAAGMAEVCVTMVLHNSEEHLAESLGALGREAVEKVVLVDNASPDASADTALSLLPAARLIRSPVNVGFAEGCNLAWREIGDARYWLLLNPDAVLDEGSVAALAHWMDCHPDVGVASPWLRDGGQPAFPGRAFPSAWIALLELLRLHRLLAKRVRARLLQGSYAGEDPAGVPSPGWLPGTAMIVRTDAVRDVGPLDEAFFLYGEDIEWCWRMRTAGWRVAVSNAGGATHHPSASSRRTWDEAEVQRRIAAGILLACERTRGRAHARAFAAITTLALAIEAIHPRRRRDARRHAAIVARAYRRAGREL
jgi:N-acetylglucosaminyl-diphospho-decaprenol L-rhamnosyltransferase